MYEFNSADLSSNILRTLKDEYQTGSDVANFMSIANNVSSMFLTDFGVGTKCVGSKHGAKHCNFQNKRLNLETRVAAEILVRLRLSGPMFKLPQMVK